MPNLETINTEAMLNELESLVSKNKVIHVANAEQHVPLGGRKYDRESLVEWKEELTKEGRPVVHNKEIYRQNYAIRDFALTLANTINMNEYQSKDTAFDELKTALTKSFFI